MGRFNQICDRIVRHTLWYRNDLWGGALKFNSQSFNTEIVNLGSGAAVHAFNYDNVVLKGANWALSPQSLVHDYNILRNYFSYIKDGGMVLITICPFSCLFSSYTKEHNFKYYPFLHPATIINFDDKERTKAFKIIQNPFKEMPLYCISKTISEVIGYIKGSIRGGKKRCNFSESANNIINSWKIQFGIKDLNDTLTNVQLSEQESRRNTLNEIINFCYERNLKPIIVIPPMHNELRVLFTRRFLDNYVWSFLANINAPIYDCMTCSIVDNDECFDNALFLNIHGAKVFTEWLVNKIKC